MKHFTEQLKTCKVITREVINELKGKTYYGKKYEIGEQILACMIPHHLPKHGFEVVNLVESELPKFYKCWKFIEYKYSIPFFCWNNDDY